MAENFSKWQGGPLFRYKAQWGSGRNNSGPTGHKRATTGARYQMEGRGAKLSHIMRSVATSFRVRFGKGHA